MGKGTMLKYPGLHPFTQSCKRIQAFRLYGFALVDASCVPIWERHMQEVLSSCCYLHVTVM
uniref:Putative ovule protein n=1 Tax=Solanum chacoense TaxID=4108 RepID=A0A0V0GH89_SOLCH